MPHPDNILEQLHQRLVMYTGENTLSSLHHFLSGYRFALDTYGISSAPDPLVVPRGFHDWVAYRLHFCESGAGWCSMLCDRSTTDQDAIDLFFQLLAEFKTREPHLVAKLIGFKKEYSETTFHRENGENVPGPTLTRSYPDSMSLITYTDDPGFFVYSDNGDDLPFPSYFPDLELFELFTGASRSLLTIVDMNWSPKPYSRV
jgi:hypothetical protein